MNWRPIIGSFLIAEMWIFLSLNLICLYCIKRGRLYANKETGPPYLVTTFNLLSETCQLLVHVSYVGPSIFLGDWIFEGQESLGVTIAATWFLGFWYLGSFIQILMAANRMSVVFLPGKRILTHKRVCFIMTFLFLLALGCVAYSQLISPCCRLCIQFLIIFLGYTTTWSTFFLLPLMGITTAEPFTITTAVFMANCGVNAVIYLTMNKELHKLVGKVSPSAVYHSTTRPQQHSQSHLDSHYEPPSFRDLQEE